MVLSREMKHSMKSTRVSSGFGANVRQENTFVPGGCLSKVSNESKASRCNPAPSRKSLAWCVELKANPSQENLSHIPQIKWKSPPKFTVNVNWRVAAGEGSQEVEVQKHRETTVREAIYPHPSVIPPSPYFSPDLGGEENDDSLTPIIPIEEEEEEESAAAESPSEISAASAQAKTVNPLVNDNSLLSSFLGLETGDLAVAAAAAATAAAVIENKERIDTELLIKLLTDPEMIKKLIDANGLEARHEPGTVSAPVPIAAPVQKTPSCMPSPVEKPSPLLISKCEQPLVRNFTNEPSTSSNFHQIPGTRQVRPLTPYPTQSSNRSFQRTMINQESPCVAGIKQLAPLNRHFPNPRNEVIKKMINKYGAPNATATIKPLTLPIPSTSKRPHMEEMENMINEYGAPHNLLPPKLLLGVGPNPLKSDMAVTLPHNPSSTGMFLARPFLPVAITAPPAKDFYHYKSLIKQHGENHEKEHRHPIFGQPNGYIQGLEMRQNAPPFINPQFQYPCMTSNSPRGWPHGPHQHNVPGRVEEDPFAKRMRFHDKSGRF